MKPSYSSSISAVVWLGATAAALHAAPPSELLADYGSDLWARGGPDPRASDPLKGVGGGGWPPLPVPPLHGPRAGPPSNGTRAEQNLCIDGALVPELLVIGAREAGTSSFCAALEGSSAILFPNSVGNLDKVEHPQRWKEGHLFDTRMSRKPFSDKMLREFGPCGTTWHRRVAIDCTSRYAVDGEVPETIALSMGKQSAQMRFVFLLREPSERLASNYWHLQKGYFCGPITGIPFNLVVHDILSGRLPDPRSRLQVPCVDFLEGGLYSQQIRRWFTFFEPEQFTFIPHFLHVDAERWYDSNHPVLHVWQKLGVGGSAPARPLNLNHWDHPSRQESLVVDDLHDLEVWFDVMGGGANEIAQLLAGTGADLYGFEGPREVEWVAEWIRSNW